MFLDKLYEVIDSRDLPVEKKLALVCMVGTAPGGIQIYTPGGGGPYMELDESNFQYLPDGFEVFTEDGDIQFIEIDRDYPPDVMLLMSSYDGMVSLCL